MTKILITGGTGFVGGHLTPLLRHLQPQAQLHLTSLHPQASSDPEIHLHALDLTDSAAFTALIKDLQPDHIYHLASLASVATSFTDPAATLANNFHLTLNLLEALRQFSPHSRVLLISSADLYAPSSQPLSETAALAPANPYAASKASQDFMAQAYVKSYHLPIVIARPFNHIGAGQAQGFVVPDFASRIVAAENNPATRTLAVGNLDSVRDFTDVRDMVRAYALLMEQGRAGEIYNLGSGIGIKIRALLDQLIALASVPITITTDQSKLRPSDNPYIVAAPTKINALGWQPEISLTQTLTDILAYWRGIMKS